MSFEYLQKWSTESLHIRARGSLPLAERERIEQILTERQNAERVPPDISAEQRLMYEQGRSAWFDRAFGKWRR